MFRSYDQLQAENILLARITQLTMDPLFWNIFNIIVIGLITGCLVDVVAVMGDVFLFVYNFHVQIKSNGSVVSWVILANNIFSTWRW
jgi:hypothetical protein